MKLQRNLARIATVGLLAFTLAGCATHYDRKTSNTLLGAGLGGATGAVLSGGDPLTTLGGAAAGGILGHVLTPEREYRRPRDRDYRRSYRRSHNRYD